MHKLTKDALNNSGGCAVSPLAHLWERGWGRGQVSAQQAIQRLLNFSLLFLFLPCATVFAQGEEAKVSVLYAQRIYQIPAQFKAITFLEEQPSLLSFRYGEEKSTHYLAFSHELGIETFDLGCAPKTFLAALFEGSSASSCDSQKIKEFSWGFVQGRDVGVWHGKKNLKVYYSIGDDLSFLFLLDNEGKHSRIDTDFLSRESLKAIIADLL